MPASTPALVSLLVVSLGLLVWRAATRERREYARFRRLRSTSARQKVYRRWLRESVAVVGGLALALWFGAAEYVGPLLGDAHGRPAVAAVRDWLAGASGTVVLVVAGVVVAAVLILPVLLARGTTLDDVPTLGDIRPLLPRTRGELRYGAGLALSAGVFEELLFRLALPALIFGIVPDALLAYAAATVVFGLLHAYQGISGIVATTVLGAVLSALVVASGSVVWPILIHIAVDLRSLVLIPVVLGTAWRDRPVPRRPAEN